MKNHIKWSQSEFICAPTELKNLGEISHLQGPVAHLFSNKIRIYCSTRYVEATKSICIYIDVDKSNPKQILNYGVVNIPPTDSGSFDEDGMMPSCVFKDNDKLLLAYSGWNSKGNGKYHNATGLLSSRDGINFNRIFPGPIMDRHAFDPSLVVTPYIMKDNGIYKNWYVSCSHWIEAGNQFEPSYGIKYATSINLIDWNRVETEVIARDASKFSIARPSVLKHLDYYQMWYSKRQNSNFRNGTGSYKLYNAKSKDGITWTNENAIVAHKLGSNNWDCMMQCYPYVIKIENKIYLFYSGNSFGRAGIGFMQGNFR